MTQLRIQSYLSSSRANGPGLRSVLWVQGCSLSCSGCFNPESHDFASGQLIAVEEIVEWFKAADETEGISISGGEPLQQPEAIIELLERVRQETELSSLLFTGFTFQEVSKMSVGEGLLACLDVLICGRYEQDLRVGRNLIGSSNKTVHFLSSRYASRDLDAVPESEVLISGDGSVVVSGIDPVRLR